MKSRYRDEENPWRQKESRKNNTIQEKVFYKHHSDGFEEGFQAAEKLYGWHRNCEETPAPLGKRVLITDGRDQFATMARIERGEGELNHWFNCGLAEEVDTKKNVWWMEIPKVEE